MSREVDVAPVAPSRALQRAGRSPHRLLRALARLTLLLAVAGCGNDSPVLTDPSSSLASATATVALSFYQVSAGSLHTCALTTDQRAFCWGDNGSGSLGIGTDTGPELCITSFDTGPCAKAPVPVLGARQYRQISAGSSHTCAVATDFRVYCWGSNTFGQLGDGSRTTRLGPVLVAGGLRFRQVDAGGLGSTCGVSYPDQRAYCWGDNRDGQLGDGTRTARLKPVAVFGDRKFRQVSAGLSHTCGVTTSNEAYCWGTDRFGNLGDDLTKQRRTRPVAVAGGRAFRQVDAGVDHTCGITTADRAFCWGYNALGQLGVGDEENRFTPRAVTGGLSFRRVTAGEYHTCGETTTNLAYCWGPNSRGELGTAVGWRSTSPVAVDGGLQFAQLSAGGAHTCGRTPSSVAYCWGWNIRGEIGNGTTDTIRTPKPVGGN